MSNRASSIALPEQLEQYSLGAAQSATQPVADFLAPSVDVSNPHGQFKKYTEKHRFLVPDTRRAVGGRAVEIGWDAEDQFYNCRPHAIDVPVDLIIEAEADPSAFQEAADLAAEVGALSHEQAVIQAAVAAAGAGTGMNVSSATTDVIDTIDQAILSVLKAAKYGSLMGVGVLFGANAVRAVKNHASVVGRYTGGGGRKGKGVSPSLDELGDLLIGQPETRGSFMVYDAGDTSDEDIQFLLDDTILIFARHPNPTRRDPSFMKTFRQRNHWMKPRSYQRDDGRVQVAGFDWSADPQITNSAAIARINITTS